MRRPFCLKHKHATGFTLLEMMIVLTIVAILAAIAVPQYNETVMRGRLVDSHTKLGDMRIQMEKYFMDNRTYANAGACGISATVLADYNADPGRSFDFTCPAGSLTATTYLLRADGRATKGMAGFVFTVDQTNAKTSAGPAGWTAAGNCWLMRKDGTCS